MARIVWYLRTVHRPRDAVKHFVVDQPKTGNLVGLVVLYGALAFWEELLAGERPPAIMPIYFLIGWLGSSGGVYLVGRVLGGKATMTSSLIALAVTFVVPLIFMPISLPLNYLASQQRSENLTSLDVGILVFGLAVSLWWVTVCVLAVAEAHGIGIAKSMFTFMASLVTATVSVLVAMGLLALIM